MTTTPRRPRLGRLDGHGRRSPSGSPPRSPPAAPTTRPTPAASGDERQGRRRLLRLPRERDPRRDLRPGARGQRHRRRDEVQHRPAPADHPGPAGRLDQPDPGVQRQPARLLRPRVHRAHHRGGRRRPGRRRRRRQAAGPRLGRGRGQGRLRRHQRDRRGQRPHLDRRPVQARAVQARLEPAVRRARLRHPRPQERLRRGRQGDVTFVPIEDFGGPDTVKALVDDTVQVADIYTTSPGAGRPRTSSCSRTRRT